MIIVRRIPTSLPTILVLNLNTLKTERKKMQSVFINIDILVIIIWSIVLVSWLIVGPDLMVGVIAIGTLIISMVCKVLDTYN